MPWHPVVVHYPIALLTFGLVVDVAALMARRDQWHRFAYALLVAGTVGAAASVITGNVAAAGSRDTIHAAVIQQHEDYGTVAFLLFLVASLGRLPQFLQRRESARAVCLWIGVAAVGLATLFVTSRHGGRLVYDRGVGVEPASSTTANQY